MVFVPGIRRAALEARLPRSQKLSPPVRRPRRRDPHRPRHGLEILPAQQTHHHLTLAPGREPTPTAAPGGRAGRHRFLNVLPHLDTPPASTRSQSSVQENPRAQERPRTPPADHRQTAKLPGGRSDRDAVGRPRHGSVCEQPRRSLAPTHTPTGTPDAAVQVSRPSATLRVGAWRGAESLSGGAASLKVGPPPPPSHTGVRRMGDGDGCLLKGRSGLGFAGKNRATWLS